MLLSNRVAIITGAARGIGRGIALKFAEEGCSIVIADVRKTEALETVKQVSSKGSKGIFIQCDVSDSRQVREMVNQTIDKFGKVDILVNDAGIGPMPKSITKVTEEEWDKVLAINLKGVFLCCKEIVPHMREKGYGKIINISSIAALCPAGPVDYTASKAGVMALTIDLGLELAPFNIYVNAILPGMIRTEMIEEFVPAGGKRDKFFAELANAVPMKRLGSPQDIAGAALFLASDLSGYMTADRIIVAGGMPWSTSVSNISIGEK